MSLDMHVQCKERNHSSTQSTSRCMGLTAWVGFEPNTPLRHFPRNFGVLHHAYVNTYLLLDFKARFFCDGLINIHDYVFSNKRYFIEALLSFLVWRTS